MANPEHLAKLKEGVEAWNRWREDSAVASPDLSLARLGQTSLCKVNFRGANLEGADLFYVDLDGSDFRGANLYRAHLETAKLRDADLRMAQCEEANLNNADLKRVDAREANFANANLRWADLRGANMGGANLFLANLYGAKLSESSFLESQLSFTTISDSDLSNVRDLDSALHAKPSTIGIDTIFRSKGNIPESFLRRAGVPGEFITYMRSLAANPIEFYSCFISYSTKDQDFADRLYADLQNRGVRCWFAQEDLKIGDQFQECIEESIRIYDKLLVLLSEQSVNSSWVEREVQAAFEKERQQGSAVLFPVRLDDAVMNCSRAWAADIRRTRHIGDFRKWKDHDSFQKSLDRLLRDLKAQDPKAK